TARDAARTVAVRVSAFSEPYTERDDDSILPHARLRGLQSDTHALSARIHRVRDRQADADIDRSMEIYGGTRVASRARHGAAPGKRKHVGQLWHGWRHSRDYPYQGNGVLREVRYSRRRRQLQ